MEFFKSIHCTSNTHCTTCRNKKDGHHFRKQIKNISSDIKEIDFQCPFGKNWGEKGNILDDTIYSSETALNKLGDGWTFINWLLQQSEETGETPKVSRHPMFEEIIPLLETKGKIEIVGQEGGKKTNAYWAIKNLRTKIQWKPGPYKKICYQFNASTVNRPPRWEVVAFLEKFPEIEWIKLGKEYSLKECLEIAATCDAFIGVSSGMSHVMHSVGIPMFLLSYNFDIRPYHGQNEYILCNDFFDTETKLQQYLKDGIYTPEVHLADPSAPVSLASCGCLPKIWDQIKDLSGSLNDIVKFVAETKTSPVNYLKRKKICRECTAIDSKGIRLFRKLNEKYYTCGEIRTQNILRNSEKEGCGCILNLKWAGNSQKCVKGYW
jgi:hypothetical protein